MALEVARNEKGKMRGTPLLQRAASDVEWTGVDEIEETSKHKHPKKL